MELSLRPPQTEALTNAKQAYDEGLRRLLIQLPTGVGKTVVFAYLRNFFGFKKKILVLVHKDKLATQAKDKIEIWNPAESVSIEMGKRYHNPDDMFVVASVPTLSRENSQRLLSLDPKDFDAVVCDEAHHSIAPSWGIVLAHFGFTPDTSNPHNILLFGVTATPNRGDGQAMGQVYDKLVFQYSMLEAINDGYLVPPIGIRIKSEVSLKNVHIRKSEYEPNELAAAIDNYQRNVLVVHAYREHADGLKAIVFTANIAHAQHLAREFNKVGIPAAAVWGTDPDRDAKTEAHQAGILQVIMNCDVYTEGYDDPTIECVIVARPLHSELKFAQIIGRGARLPYGVNNLIEALAAGWTGKKDYIVIDIADTTEENSLASLASIFGLPASLDMKGKTVVEVAKKFEEAQEKYPNVDFSDLTDIAEIVSHATRVDLFLPKVPDSINNATKLMWHRTSDSNYILRLPENHESISVFRSLTNHWSVKGTINKNHFIKDGFASVEKAIVFADSMISVLGRGLLQYLRRNSAGNKEKARPVDWIFIKRLCPPDQLHRIPADLTHAQAKELVVQLMTQQLALKKR